MILANKGSVALRNLHTIYCFASLKLTQYIVGFILSVIASFVSKNLDIVC